MDDSHLCFMKPVTVKGSHGRKEHMNFDVLDLEKREIVWQIDDAERVFFKADKR